MATTVQLNTRIDPELKSQGDVVFSREGLTSSEVVRAVWEHAARTQRVPSFIKRPDGVEPESRVQVVREAAGLASKLTRAMGFESVSTGDACDYETLRDEMYDEMIERMDERHV